MYLGYVGVCIRFAHNVFVSSREIPEPLVFATFANRDFVFCRRGLLLNSSLNVPLNLENCILDTPGYTFTWVFLGRESE